MGWVLFLVALAAFGFAAAHFLTVRGADKAAAVLLVLARTALVLMVVLVLVSTCAGSPG
jgi:formate-dependent nitrite reductase membrane component NrfD